MFADYLFHPDHVVPAGEFAAAFVELTDFDITEVTVKMLAVPGEILILCHRVGDSCIKVYKTSRNKFFLECFIQIPAVSFAVRIAV